MRGVLQPPARPVLAIDLGGTLIRAAHLAPDLTVAHRKAIPTMPERGAADVVRRTCDLARDSRREARAAGRPEPEAVVISAPGPLDPWGGIVHNPSNLPGWDEVPLAAMTGEALDLPAFLERDTNVAILAEWQHGAAAGKANAIYLTVSTGVGGSFILNSRLLQGADDSAGEIGHITVDLSGSDLDAGLPGHVESIASGAALARAGAAALAQGDAPVLAGLLADGAPLDARMVAAAADAGDPACLAILERAWLAVGALCAGLVNAVNPDVIVVGGGIADHRPDLHAAIRTEIARRAFSRPARRAHVERPHFGEDVSLVGAVPLVAQRFDDPAYRRPAG